MSQRIRIISDGTPRNTRVETEDGQLLKGVQKIRWELDIDGLARAQILFVGVPVNVEGEEDEEGWEPMDPETYEGSVPNDLNSPELVDPPAPPPGWDDRA